MRRRVAGRHRLAAGLHRLVAEDGSAGVLGVGILVAIAAVVAAVTVASALLVERHRLGAAADAAALAAADAASGLRPGSPCAEADRVARANGGGLTGCRRDGTTVTVRVSSRDGGWPIDATATAGQSLSADSDHIVGSKK